jgi:signal peptidase I
MKPSPQTFDDKHAVKCELASEVLHSSGQLELKVTGWSMVPAIWPGDTLVIEAACSDAFSEGDIVLFRVANRFVAHRVVTKNCALGESTVLTQGDAVQRPDAPVAHDDLLGRVSSIVRNGKSIAPSRDLRFSERAVAAVFRRSEIAARIVAGVHGMRPDSPSQV